MAGPGTRVGLRPHTDVSIAEPEEKGRRLTWVRGGKMRQYQPVGGAADYQDPNQHPRSVLPDAEHDEPSHNEPVELPT